MATSDPTAIRVVPIRWDDPAAEEARRIRMVVFVDEQKVPAEMELDEIDPTAMHVLALDAAGVALGTGRMFADPKNAQRAKIGRMAVLAEARGRGVGAAILAHLVAEARGRGFAKAALSSQTHAMGFYARQGFVAYGAEYDDAGIPHRDMELVLAKP